MQKENIVEIDDNDEVSQEELDNVGGIQESGEESSEMTASEDDTSWITWFVSIRGNDFFCEVEESFIQDDFNLTGLANQVPYYEEALDVILDIEITTDQLKEEEHDLIETTAELLYGMIHARYILTSAGMHRMYSKYQHVDFGRCPRSLCQGQPVLPVGLSDSIREFSVQIFCPKCQETYHPRSSKHGTLDGAYFGTTFSHLFLLTHPELIVPKSTDAYVPRIFGFKINESSLYYKLREKETQSNSNETTTVVQKKKSSSSKANNKGSPTPGVEGTSSQQHDQSNATVIPTPSNNQNNTNVSGFF